MYVFSGVINNVNDFIIPKDIKMPNIDIWFYINDDNKLGFTGEIIISEQFPVNLELEFLKETISLIINKDITLSDSFECFSINHRY